MNTYRTAFIRMAVLLGIAASLHAADVTGKWKSDFDTQIGHLNYVFDLKSDGDKLTGKAIRTLDGAKTEIAITEGKLAGDAISFVEPLKREDQDIRIEYSGKVAGDEMKLTRKVADFATTEITAKREPETAPATPAITGKWQAEFDSQIGTQKYVYVLKADGDKLTGRAQGEFGGQKTDTEIVAGKLNGADVTFVENM